MTRYRTNQKITVKLGTNGTAGTMIVDAMTRNGLAIHNSIHPWLNTTGRRGKKVRPVIDTHSYTITHIASGQAIKRNIESLSDAKRVVEKIEPLMDWRRTSKDCIADGNALKLGSIIRDVLVHRK